MVETEINIQFYSHRLMRCFTPIWEHALTVVEAPEGYGKTMALRHFLHQQHRLFLWVTLNGSSGQEGWDSFCGELKRAFTTKSKHIAALARLGFPCDSVKAAEALRLLEELLPRDEETILVLDDYESFNTPENSRWLEYLAQGLKQRLHLVLLSCEMYRGSREALGVPSEMLLIGKEELAFRTDEVSTYFELNGVHIEDDLALEFARSTEGRIGVLYLCMLRCRAGQSLMAYDVYMQSHLEELIAQEIFAKLDTAAQSLLLYLGPLVTFTFEQAVFIHPQTTVTMLLQICARNALIRFDERQDCYVIHTIFRKYLQTLLAAAPKKTFRDVYCRTGDWFVQQGRYLPAIQAFYRAGDFDKTLDTIELHRGGNLPIETRSLFAEISHRCPEIVLKRHLAAALVLAQTFFEFEDQEQFEQQCSWLEHRLAELPQNDVWANALRGELQYLSAFLVYNDMPKMSYHYRRSFQLLQRPTALICSDSVWTMGSPSVLYMFHSGQGELRQEVRVMQEHMPIYLQLTDGQGMGAEDLFEAEAFYQAGAFSEAVICLERGETRARTKGQTSLLLCAHFLKARIALFQGEFHRVGVFMREMSLMINKYRHYCLMHTMDLCNATLYADIDQGLMIPSWIQDGDATGSNLYRLAYGAYYLVHGRALLLQGQYTRLLGLFRSILQQQSFAQHLLFEIMARIYIAAALTRLGDPEEALVDLEKSLSLAADDQIRLAFVTNADYLLPLLLELEKSESRHEDLPAIIRLSTQWLELKQRQSDVSFFPQRKPLSPREEEIARLAAAGRSNRQIAEMLTISPDTVKRTLTNIYAKLGIFSRLSLEKHV